MDLGMTRVPSVATLGLAHGPKIFFDKRKFPMLREFDRNNCSILFNACMFDRKLTFTQQVVTNQ